MKKCSGLLRFGKEQSASPSSGQLLPTSHPEVATKICGASGDSLTYHITPRKLGSHFDVGGDQAWVERLSQVSNIFSSGLSLNCH